MKNLEPDKYYKKTILCKTKNINRLKEIAKLVLEILNGSLKINSSIIGNISVIFKMLDRVNLNSLRIGNKLKYLKGITIRIPVIMSITIRIRNDFHTSFRKTEMELIS